MATQRNLDSYYYVDIYEFSEIKFGRFCLKSLVKYFSILFQKYTLALIYIRNLVFWKGFLKLIQYHFNLHLFPEFLTKV
jgi:hypothetical protein